MRGDDADYDDLVSSRFRRFIAIRLRTGSSRPTTALRIECVILLLSLVLQSPPPQSFPPPRVGKSRDASTLIDELPRSVSDLMIARLSFPPVDPEEEEEEHAPSGKKGPSDECHARHFIAIAIRRGRQRHQGRFVRVDVHVVDVNDAPSGEVVEETCPGCPKREGSAVLVAPRRHGRFGPR